jgi:hypothetical protein
MRELIVKARRARFNTVIFLLVNVRFQSLSRKVHTSKALSAEWPLETLQGVVQYARENGLEVIPELKLLGKQEKLLGQYYPELMFNKETYDPRNEKTYEVTLPLLDEVINLIRPKALHIGHDEITGHKEETASKLRAWQQGMLPPNLFLADVKRLHDHLKQRGVETWMWGDMLIAPAEFPAMRAQGLHGTVMEYFKIRSQIPTDIVIGDWHYEAEPRQTEFPSALAFKNRGHRVLGVTSRKEGPVRNFSRYMATKVKGDGMITWTSSAGKGIVHVDRIIALSGEVFWSP